MIPAEVKFTMMVQKPGTVYDPICGLFVTRFYDKSHVVEHELDLDLQDNDQVPLQEDGRIEDFLQNEELLYAVGVWIDETSIRTGYENSHAGYFYKSQSIHVLNEIRVDIEAFQRECKGLLESIFTESEGIWSC